MMDFLVKHDKLIVRIMGGLLIALAVYIYRERFSLIFYDGIPVSYKIISGFLGICGMWLLISGGSRKAGKQEDRKAQEEKAAKEKAEKEAKERAERLAQAQSTQQAQAAREAREAQAGQIRHQTAGAAQTANAPGTKFCHNCGKPIPGGCKFCPECGAAQKLPSAAPASDTEAPGAPASGEGSSSDQLRNQKPGWGCLLGIVLLVVAFVGLLVSLLPNGNTSNTRETAAWETTYATESYVPQQTTRDTVVEYIPSDWASDYRYLDDGGYCSVMELDDPIYSCRQVDFTLSAEGNYGASTKGTWEVHFRVNGIWQYIANVEYDGSGEETFTIWFDYPTNFDAVCAFPQLRGNYSYQSVFYLSNAHLD